MKFLLLMLLTSEAFAVNSPYYLRSFDSNLDLGGLNQNFTDISSCFQNSLSKMVTPTSCPNDYALTGAQYNSCGTQFGGTCEQIGNGGKGFWAASGNNIYNTNSGFVGINTSSPRNQLDVLGVIRAQSTPFVNPTTGLGLEMAYDSTIGQGYLTPYDRTNSLFKQMLIQGYPIIIASSGTANNYVINPTSTTFSANYAVLAPIVPTPGVVSMFPTASNTVSGSDAWTVLIGTGPFLSTTGTTTRGLQEAINFSAYNGYPLRVYGWGSTFGGGTQPFIVATSGISFPAVDQYSAKFYDVNITFAPTVNGPALSFDSAEVSDIDFIGGQIVYQPSSPGSTSYVAYVNPVTVGPIYGLVTYTASRIFLSNIASPASGGTAVAVFGFNLSHAGVNNNFFGGIEFNGTGSGASANTQYGVEVFGAISTTTFQQNIIDIADIHKVLNSGVQEGTSATNQANYRDNIWRIGGINTAGASADGFNTYGSSDTITIGAITNGEGSLNRCIVLEPGANSNNVTYGGCLGATTANVVNSGGQNIIQGNGNIIVSSITASGSLTGSTLALSNPVNISNGGTGETSFTSNGILYGNGTSGLQVTPVIGSGGILIGTNLSPSTGTITGSTGITIATNTAPSAINISVTTTTLTSNFTVPLSSTVVSATLTQVWANTTISTCIATSTITLTLPVSGNVQVGFVGRVYTSGLGTDIEGAIMMDGAFQQGASSTIGNNGISEAGVSYLEPFSFDFPITNVSSGIHNFCLAMMTNTGSSIGNFYGPSRLWAHILP